MLSKLFHGEVVKGTQKCNVPDCEKEFKWVYQYWQPKNMAVVEIYQKKKDEECLTLLDKQTLDARCYCNNCQRLNFFKAEI